MPQHSVRLAYQRFLDPECVPPGRTLIAELHAEIDRSAGAGPHDLAAARLAADEWAAGERRRFTALLATGQDESTTVALVRRAVLGCAPLGLVSGAWLQWWTAPGNADDPVALRVLARYADDLGVGRPRAARGSAFNTLLDRLGLAGHATPVAAVALDRRIPDYAFRVPAVLLAMSRRPDEFRAELLGADLALRVIGLPPALALVAMARPDAVDWPTLDPGIARVAGAPAAANECAATVREFLAGAPDEPTVRLVAGFRWALAAVRDWQEMLHTELTSAIDPAYDVAELLRLRAAEGASYHGHYRLAGRSLADWLTESRTDPWPLLTALAESRLVRPGQAAASPLVTALVGEHGPMFRVFGPADLAVLRRWIDGLPPHGTPPPVTPPPAVAVPQMSVGEDEAGEDDASPRDLREAYHRLQGRVLSPAVRRFALAYARGWLARAAHDIDAAGLVLPEHWPADGLRPWLIEQHQRHAQEFDGSAGEELPDRAALIDSTVQLAPLTLIDGAWLQGFTDHEQASSAIGFPLFDTYWDELGNGLARLNHPRIYRELLTEMATEVPPTASVEFARWPGFRDESFALPVYWLSIGRFPRTFLPEVLGLNLAMELSGVGGSYRRAHLALREHGFSTRFVDIHNTIDNVATGHSAWAADAIDACLSAIPPGPARISVWPRVRAGYRSLNPPGDWRSRRVERRERRRHTAELERTP